MFTEVVEKLLCYSHVYRGCEVDSHKGYCATVMFTEVVFKLCYSHVYRGIYGVLQSCLQGLYLSCATVMFTGVVK